MPVTAVIGGQWGDEGKGKIVDVLGAGMDIVARYQGGANAGHTVQLGDKTFVLHQIPSGILHPGVRCVLGHGMVVDPVALVELTVDHGNLTWMQYAAVRQLKGPFVGRQRRKELCVIDDLCNTLKAHHDGSVDFVLVNLLPSYVVTLTKNGVAATTSPTRVNGSRIAEGAGARFGS